VGTLGNSDVITDIRIELWLKESCQNSETFQKCMAITRDVAGLAFDKVENIDDFTGMRIWVMEKADFG
jgi:hypothetical protein